MTNPSEIGKSEENIDSLKKLYKPDSTTQGHIQLKRVKVRKTTIIKNENTMRQNELHITAMNPSKNVKSEK